MKKTRLGNDIAVTIALFTLNADGEREPYALGDNSLSLTASTALDTAQMQIATVAGNIVEAILPGSAQRATGVYSLTLREEHGESSRVVDICDAFEIVSCSCEAGGADIANNTTLGYEAVVVVVSPSLSAESSTFVSTATEQAFTPEQQLRGRTNIGLPIHRLWMTLDRSQGIEGVVYICKRAGGYAEENAATIAAMVAANDSDTPSHDMFLITIFDGDTAVTGELNCIAAEQWVAEIEVGADPAAIHKWVYTVDCELVALGDIDRGRVVFASTPGDIARGAVITGSRSLELSSEQIGIARGNMQIYTVVCDTEGNLLTTASRLAVAKMSEVQQDPSKRLDSLFLVKLVDGDTFHTVAMTWKGNYWLGATPYNKLPNNEAPLAYLLIEATIVDGVFNLTLRRPSLLTSELCETLPNGNIKVEGIGEFMAATPSGDPNHMLYLDAGLVWNAETNYWEYGGIVNITTAELRRLWLEAYTLQGTEYLIGWFRQSLLRINICRARWSSVASIQRMFELSSTLQVAVLAENGRTALPTNLNTAFYGCRQLKSIATPINMQYCTTATSAFVNCYKLEDFTIFKLKINLEFTDSSMLSKSSLLNLIQNAAPTTAIAITVHADVYAWASTDAEIQEALTAQPLITLISA